MWLMGFTLNLMTLLAMSLIIGILVDDAIVVIENIQRHLEMGKEKRTASIDGRMEIGMSAVSITLVIVVVFLPILFLQVFVADMLKQFSIVVITSTLTSLLVCFTLTPWLSSRIGKKEELQPTNFMNRFLLWFEKQLNTFIEWYGHQLEWVFRHKLLFTGIVILLAVLTFGIMKQGIIGKEMMSTGDQGKFRLNLEYDKTTTVQENNIRTQRIENFILQQPEVATLFSNIAGPSTGIGSLGVGSANLSEFTIQLKPEKERKVKTEEYMISLREELKRQFPGVSFSMAVLGLLPKQAPIKITLTGSDPDLILETAEDLKLAIEEIPGADNVRLSVEAGNPEYKVIPDKDRMQRLGLTTAYVGMNLRTAFTGNEDATLTENGTEYPVRVWLDDFDRKNYEDVQRLSIVNPMNIPVEVSQFAQVRQDNSPSLLERLDRQPSVTLTSESLGRPSGTLADDVISYLKTRPLPDGIELVWGADIKTQNESFRALASVLLISFILIYLIMVALYDNYIYPFVALFAIPMAAIGAFLALNLSLNQITLFAQLGLIMLMGLVTKNSILIVDFTNQLKARGKSYKEALIIAGKERLRPILMTTVAMAVGMLPIALAKGTASEWKNGLAWVIIGGLISSMILTVYIVPMVYYVVDSIGEKKHNRIKK
jgi:HAE1 family hydrophobic/amphiphilic exporter-1